MGCWFALDDFGSGMSSFAYLQSLPVDALKIAGAFLRHIETDPVEYAMVEAINRVGHVMRLKIVAEGVEHLDTLETLRTLGVDYAQGYAIAEPVPLEELVAGHAAQDPGARSSHAPSAQHHPQQIPALQTSHRLRSRPQVVQRRQPGRLLAAAPTPRPGRTRR